MYLIVSLSVFLTVISCEYLTASQQQLIIFYFYFCKLYLAMTLSICQFSTIIPRVSLSFHSSVILSTSMHLCATVQPCTGATFLLFFSLSVFIIIEYAHTSVNHGIYRSLCMCSLSSPCLHHPEWEGVHCPLNSGYKYNISITLLCHFTCILTPLSSLLLHSPPLLHSR